MKIDVPDEIAEPLAEFLRKYDEKREEQRPLGHGVRSFQEAMGIVIEEFDEFRRQLRKSKVSDPQTEKLLNDAMELSVVTFISYVDLCPDDYRPGRDCANGRRREVRMERGGFNQMCGACKKRQAWHMDAAGRLFCEECLQ